MSCAIANQPVVPEHAPRAGSERVARYGFILVSVMLFVAGAAVTGMRMGSRSAMEEMSMPGQAQMSSPWMRAPGQGWPSVATSFVAMWLAMTVTMMMPSVAPALWRYRRATPRARGTGSAVRTSVAGGAYLVPWTVAGVIVFLAGAPVASLQWGRLALAHVAPIATGAVLLLAGAWQLTARKARHLASCRREPTVVAGEAAGISAAARFGVRLGVHCMRSCANLMLIPLVVGIMSVPVMTAVAVAITAERLAPRGDRVARATGVFVAVAGLYLILRVVITR